MNILTATVACLVFAHAGQVRLAWNANPAAEAVREYRLYQIGSPNVLLGASAETSLVVDAEPGAQVSVAAFNGLEGPLSAPVTVPTPAPTVPELSRASWTLKPSSQETLGENAPAGHSIDGIASTIWHTAWDALPPHYLVMELPRRALISFLTYLPRPTGTNGMISEYEIEISLDGITWTRAAQGTWARDAALKTAQLDLQSARFVRLWGRDRFMSAAEVRLHGVYEPDEPQPVNAVRLTVQTSEDLRQWQDMPELVIPRTAPRAFYRLKMEVEP